MDIYRKNLFSSNQFLHFNPLLQDDGGFSELQTKKLVRTTKPGLVG